MSKSQNKTRFILKNTFQELTSGVFYKFQCGLCCELYCGEYVRHLDLGLYWNLTFDEKES